MESAWAVYWILTGFVGMLGGSIGTITILHVTVMKRLQAMGRGRGLGVVIVIEAVCPLLIHCGVLFVPLTLLLQQLVFETGVNWWAGWWFFLGLVLMILLAITAMLSIVWATGTFFSLPILVSCNLVMSGLSLKQFYGIVREIAKEIEEGGEVTNASAVLIATKKQLVATGLAMISSIMFWISSSVIVLHSRGDVLQDSCS